MRCITLLFSISCFLASCNAPHYVDFFPYHDDGVIKPKVAFLPVQFSCEKDATLAQYLDDRIRWIAMDRATLFFFSRSSYFQVLEKNSDAINSKDPLNFAHCFHPADFIVETDVVENNLIPFSKNLYSCFGPFPYSTNRPVRTIKMRVRITDIRSETPKVILFEILEKNQLVPGRNEQSYSTRHIYEEVAEQVESRLEEVIWTR